MVEQDMMGWGDDDEMFFVRKIFLRIYLFTPMTMVVSPRTSSFSEITLRQQ
jgi:hypothetical protein